MQSIRVHTKYFEFADTYAIVRIAKLFSLTPQDLHQYLLVDDDVRIEQRNKLIPADLSKEQEIFKVPSAKFSLYTFLRPDELYSGSTLASQVLSVVNPERTPSEP
ncbi:MAG: hypothetical protein SPD11_02335 [Sphaerochaetaceae bacterium]|nr:hypothetical protein [Sphaerochaetaceae bacterium]